MVDRLKYWIRSGSLDFARSFSNRQVKNELATLNWRGHLIYYQPGTSDAEILYKILLKPERKREYQPPTIKAPKIIFDIGANIGAATLWLNDLYPSAQIYSFEPAPRNFSILQKNVKTHSNIKPINAALGATDGTEQLFLSDNPNNLGGCSFFEAGSNTTESISVTVYSPQRILQELKIETVDLIKIVTEGAEHNILTSFPDSILKKTQWIFGELHGNKDFELMAYLSEHFNISLNKDLNCRLCNFAAQNKYLGPLT